MGKIEITVPDLPVRSSGPTVAVAFGGGGARGVAHIHIIETLDAMGIRPVAISGSSIGSIMGAAMASGLSGQEIRDHTLATIGKPSNAFGRIWKAARPLGVKDAMENGLRLGQFNVERILEEFLPAGVARNFEDLTIPTKIMVTDYFGHCEVVCETGELRPAIAASAAIPAVFRPVKIGDRIMVDGGIFNPVPFDKLSGLADIIIGVDVVGLPSGTPGQAPSSIDMMFGANQLMMQSIIEMKRQAYPPHILLRPEVHQYRVLDFLKAKEILNDSKGVAEQLKRDLDAAFAFHDLS
ncbi:MAG: patatin-like phospholipase family protein [Hoeflea sp.]|uniref:patatin-like phospholipase family protein n=1 Tax=Hoeflea sp. TaxID=1940281 RepID=UPI001DA09F3C|nr:patatin-like phospholipase family protein [Hoeflea sp.]MBU4529119.1 patatin-like phospholipase family protein [Alphaproteobacteria bacterium]MBU4543524.1 patatin-like phospholipase family protein [Alphaproteobacteria bacterium]MBU4549149.1 patatin-like phospholipase family protein [Alphaproteobacteria bacterium]MBV1725284.1 patatin-like phospholipase family protein [Hoeflea sp.]MBV1785245.1 patatin-like phospholipase family protein [Hoeflea sp.]